MNNSAISRRCRIHKAPCWTTTAPLVTCSLLLGAPKVLAAEGPRGLQLGADVGVRTARDDLIVPRASSGPSLGVAGRFLASVRSGIVDTRLRFHMALMFDRDGHPAAGLAHGMHAGYLWCLPTPAGHWSFALGPLLAWETDVLWLAKWDDAHAYWLGRRFVALTVRAGRALSSSWRLDLDGDVNLFGGESRPPVYRLNNQDALTRVDFYLASVNQQPRLGTLLNWQAVRLQAMLSPTAPGKQSSSIGVETRFLHSSRPDDVYVLEFTLRYTRTWGMR